MNCIKLEQAFSWTFTNLHLVPSCPTFLFTSWSTEQLSLIGGLQKAKQKNKNYKIRRRKHRCKSCDLGLGNNFSDVTPKAQASK